MEFAAYVGDPPSIRRSPLSTRLRHLCIDGFIQSREFGATLYCTPPYLSASWRFAGCSEGRTALTEAVDGGYEEVVEELLWAKANPNAMTNEGVIPFTAIEHDD